MKYYKKSDENFVLCVKKRRTLTEGVLQHPDFDKRPTLTKGNTSNKRPTLIQRLPSEPGVYIMKDAGGAVLYVGKAKNLRKRVASYFKRGSESRYQIKFLMEHVADISCIETKTEKEALLLEYKLIKEHLPKYNIALKDSKTFNRIKLSTYHAFPGIMLTRQVKKDNSSYFGPYVSSLACRNMLEEAIKFFRIRTCSDREFANRVRPCIQYDIGRCTAPCVGYVSREEYARQIQDAVLFLKGKNKLLIRNLKEKMKEASSLMKYESAARFRDLISDIKDSLEKQTVARPEIPDIGEAVEDFGYSALIGEPLKRKLGLSMLPHFIECVDISNIQGSSPCGAIVTFVDGAPMKARYRLFNIYRTDVPNDYAMMMEVLERRFKHAEWGVPDLLLLDGGKGQLNIAVNVIRELNVQISVAAVAKISGSHKKSETFAHVFIPNRANPVKFKKGSPELLYLIRIRDEAHRFVIRHFRRRLSSISVRHL